MTAIPKKKIDIVHAAEVRMSLQSLVYQPQLNTLKPYWLWSLNPNLTHQPPVCMGFQTVSIHHGASTASEALKCNQSSVCSCQVNSAKFHLRKNRILGLIFGGLCQE